MSVIHRLAAAGVWGALVFGGPSLYAQTFTGVGSCGGSECHTRSGEVDWLNKLPGGREHRGSLKRLRDSADVSEKYAKAVGLDNVFAPKGMCLKCHGTYIEAGKVNEGVGCEGCHGPAGTFREFHQRTPKDYAGAVSKGLRDLRGKPTAWTRVCTSCHVLSDKPEYGPLLDAGHKEGNRWKPQDKYTGVQAHWKRVSYKADVIASAAAGKAVTVTVATPPPDPPPAPGPTPPTAGTPAPPAAGTKPPTPVPSPPDPKPSPPVRSPGAAVTPPAPAKVPGAPPPEPVPPPDPVAREVSGVSSPLALPPPPPVTQSDLLAALQTRVAQFFTRLLGSGVTPDTPLAPLPASTSISGPDAELLRLQAEALALAVEALNLKVKPAKSPSEK